MELPVLSTMICAAGCYTCIHHEGDRPCLNMSMMLVKDSSLYEHPHPIGFDPIQRNLHTTPREYTLQLLPFDVQPRDDPEAM